MTKNKKIIIYGYGITGQTIVKYLLQQGCNLTVIDNKPLLKNDIDFLRSKDVSLLDENEVLSNIHEYESCFVSPGVDLRKNFFVILKQSKVDLRNDLYFLTKNKNSDLKTIAVTGTNGKTTFCTLLNDLFKYMGLESICIGNIGNPILDLFLTKHDAKIVIIELSSYQIELIPKDLLFDFGAILNIEPDHLDRYTSFKEYKSIKESLAQHSKAIFYDKNTTDIKNHSSGVEINLLDRIKKIKHSKECYELEIDNQKFLINAPFFKGFHNIKNIFNVLLLIKRMGIKMSDDQITNFFKSYHGLPHRFETIKIWKNIHFINDSKATNIASSIAALESLSENVHLIFGGDLKGQKLDGLEKIFEGKVISLSLIGQDADKIMSYFNTVVNNIKIHQFASLENALIDIKENISTFDTVLLSPGCASFGMFKNYMHRGDVFKELVERHFNCS